MLNEIACDNDAGRWVRNCLLLPSRLRHWNNLLELVQSNLKDAFGDNWSRLIRIFLIPLLICFVLIPKHYWLFIVLKKLLTWLLILLPWIQLLQLFEKRIRAFSMSRQVDSSRCWSTPVTYWWCDRWCCNQCQKLIAMGWGTSYAMPVEDLVSGEEVNIDTYVSLMATRAAMKWHV